MLAQSRIATTSALDPGWSDSLADFDVLGRIDHKGNSKLFRAVCRRGRLKARVTALKASTLVILLPPESQLMWSQITTVEVPGCRIHQSLYHPNIVSLFSHFAAPNAYIQVLEYCESGNLNEFIASYPGNVLGEEALRNFLRNIASALVYLEGNNIVHRNLEPRSVLVPNSRVFKVGDFTNAVTLSDTRTTNIACHAISFYSAPEIIAQESHSFSSDVWSLGCLLLFCHSGPSSVEACSQDSSFFKTETTLSLSESPDALQELISSLLQIKPERRMICSQALLHPWTQASPCSKSRRIESTHQVEVSTKKPLIALSGLELNAYSIHSAAEKKPSLNVIYRRPATLSLPQRVVSEPPFGREVRGSEVPRRSKSDGIQRDRLTQFFLRPTPNSRITKAVAQRSDLPPLDARSLDEPPGSQAINLSVLSPNEYRYVHGTITILPSRCFLVDARHSANCAQAGEVQLLLVNPALNTAHLCAAAGEEVKGSQLESQKNGWHLGDLPEPYNGIYREAVTHLEELKERTPRLTLHLVDGKCMMMCNVPLPNIEILLRSSFPEISSPKTMLRVRLVRRTKRLEIARRTSYDSSSEWVKRVLTCSDAFPFLPADDWGSLDDLERRGLRVLEKFLPVCNSASEIGFQAEGMETIRLDDVDAQDDGSPFDIDFTPNFVPELASSVPPRSLSTTKLGLAIGP